MTRTMVAAAGMALAVAMTAGAARAQSVRVPEFLPSENAFQFSNGWPHEPDGVINVAGINVPIGDAANGLCGGMVLAVRDYYESGYHIPMTEQHPASGTTLFDYISMRLFDTFTPNMVARLYGLQATPFDGDRQGTMQAEWPLIKAEIDAGHLTPLQLVRVHADFNPFRLGENHQVLAYGYDISGASVTIYIYDPNHVPFDYVNHLPYDHVTINYNTASRTVSQSTGEPLYAFFREDYTPKEPPATETWTNGFEGADASAWWKYNAAGVATNDPNWAHSGKGYGAVLGVPGWNAVNVWVPTLPGRNCTMEAFINPFPFLQPLNGMMRMRSAAAGNPVLGADSITYHYYPGYIHHVADFTADGWWAIFSVDVIGTGATPFPWVGVDDVTVVCEAW